MKIEKPEGKYVVDGQLVGASASAIESFDELNPFGCNRKYWFQAVAGLKWEGSEATKTGEAVHSQIEHYLLMKEDALGNIARPGLPIINSLIQKYPDYAIEQWIPDGFNIGGVKIRGRLDFTARNEGRIINITDWKTSSDVKKYAKTAYQLKKNTQLLIYRQYAEEAGCDEKMTLNHVYFQTKGRPYSTLRETTINSQELADGIGTIKNTLAEMKKVVKVLDSDEVKPDKRKCHLNTKIECPYAKHCTKGATNMASLISKFLTTPSISAATPTPAPSPVVGVLPPDAPPSRPELAADPVPGFSEPVRPPPISAEAKAERVPPPPETLVGALQDRVHPASGPLVSSRPVKPRGRPKVTKAVSAAADEVERLVVTALQPAPEPAVKVLELTIGHTATINMGNYQSAKVEVTMRASVNGDVETARKELTLSVQSALAREVEIYQKEKK